MDLKVCLAQAVAQAGEEERNVEEARVGLSAAGTDALLTVLTATQCQWRLLARIADCYKDSSFLHA